jgi:hypothetical protein
MKYIVNIMYICISERKSLFILFLCLLLLIFNACENPIMVKLLEPLVPQKHIHNWSEWRVITAPTCTTAGEETRTCTLDATHTETRTIAALGHDWGNWAVIKEPTETEQGEETRTCARDPSHAEKRPIDRLSFGNAAIDITFKQIAEGSPSLGGSVIIYRSPSNGQTSYSFTLEHPEQYTSITWYVYNITASGGTFTLSSSNIAYNMIGTHVLTLEVIKDGILYATTITFEVRQ